MQIAIIADIHNNEVNLRKVLDYCKDNNVEIIICCGDLASKNTLDFLCDNFPKKIYYVFGNMDMGQLRELEEVDEYRNAQIFRDSGKIELEDKKIAFTHYPAIANQLAESGKFSHVFYGHTHKPWNQKVGDCELLNPGNVAGEIYPPTFAIWDTRENSFKLIRIHELK